MKKWKKILSPYGTNYVLEGTNFYISYNSFIDAKYIHNSFHSDNNVCETALVKNDKFYILNGDFKKEYEKRIESYKKCKEFFLKNKKLKSSWSNL